MTDLKELISLGKTICLDYKTKKRRKAKEEKQEFLKVMNKLSDEKREEKYQEDKSKLEKLSSRNEELTILITKLYEDHALGKIPVKHFDRLFNTYGTEQQDLEKQIQYFEQEIESYHQRKVDTNKFLKMIEKYTDIEELTVPMINEYIEKVVVHEATGGRKGIDRKQQVDVYFNFIGNRQVPQKADIEKGLKNGIILNILIIVEVVNE
ncbi:TnpX site-specific recombinase family protein [Streptococcus equi subsp. zooepidemicus]|nr:TnpX site-specific recombinase family protein [Streptococcus equi subsp. zooepidemicus]VED85675.1 TnpX site-specific recombinase family protein [Streptococcus equi subsp. equi]